MWHFCNIMVTTRARHSANKVMAQQYDDAVNKSPIAKKKCSDQAPPVMAQQYDDAVYKSPVAKKKCSDQAPPDTDATLPVPTHMLVIQAEQL